MTDAPRRPRSGHWVIMAGDTPTSFRAREREVLEPTFVGLRRTQPDVELKWFERGTLWASPDAAQEELFAHRQQRGAPRARDWRPGGEHKDPRKKYETTRDQKRARIKMRARFGEGPAARTPGGAGPFDRRRGPKGEK